MNGGAPNGYDVKDFVVEGSADGVNWTPVLSSSVGWCSECRHQQSGWFTLGGPLVHAQLEESGGAKAMIGDDEGFFLTKDGKCLKAPGRSSGFGGWLPDWKTGAGECSQFKEADPNADGVNLKTDGKCLGLYLMLMRPCLVTCRALCTTRVSGPERWKLQFGSFTKASRNPPEASRNLPEGR